MPLKKLFLILIVVASMSGVCLNCSAWPINDGEEAAAVEFFDEIKATLFDFFDEFTSPDPNPASQTSQGEPPPEPDLRPFIDPRG